MTEPLVVISGAELDARITAAVERALDRPHRRLYTTHQVADAVGLSERRIRQLIAAGARGAFKVGASTRVDLDEFIDWIRLNGGEL